MTAALNEATSRLKALESNHTTTATAIQDISTSLCKHNETITQQSKDLQTLGKAVESQQATMTALKNTQIQQSTQIQNMSQTQTAILQRLDALCDSVQASKPPAEDRMAAGDQNEWSRK